MFGTFFTFTRVVEADIFSSLTSIFAGDQAYAETSSGNSPQSGNNIQNPKFSLQANSSYASYLQDKNNKDGTNANTDYISDEKAFYPQNNGRDTSDFSLVEMIVYPVESGDTLSEIAEKFNTSVNTIRWENNISGQKISIGQKLNIFPDFIGVRHTVRSGDTMSKIADEHDAIADDIKIFNGISDGEILKKDRIVFVPNGIVKPVVSKSTPSSGSNYTTSSNTKVVLGRYVKPAQGVITSRYGPRKGGFHYGIDIGNVRETPVVAAIDGVVTKVVAGCIEGRKNCGGGYGNYVEVDDSLGNKARYSHLSKIFVSVGQPVRQKDKLATMGNTGKSTGPHLDFSLENSNGSKMRPPEF